MKKTVLITGASGGIGRALAEVAASKGNHPVLVARNIERLETLEKELIDRYGCKPVIIQKDLCAENAAKELSETLEQMNIHIDVLINNAGTGGYGLFHSQDPSHIRTMINLNMLALTEVTRMLLPQMIRRDNGKILNIASTAAFLPGPFQAVYYATKAYVVSFSQAIADEVAANNITVTAYCPGATETGFAKSGNLESTKLFRGKLDKPEKVAECAYRAMEKGRLVAGREPFLMFVMRYILPFLSRRSVLRISRKFMEEI